MKEYICIACSHVYTEKSVPADRVCKRTACPGDGITGLCIEHQSKKKTKAGANGQATAAPITVKECGLCVLLMDASGSMFFDPAFKNMALPSQYGEKFCNKAEIVSKAAAQAIFELRQMTNKENAYICAIKFDDQQALMFNDTVGNILKKHQNAAQLAQYFYKELKQMQKGTNINAALKMGHAYVDKFINGQVPGMEHLAPMFHAQYIPEKSDWLEIPNVRLMVYTDGEQLSHYGSLENPFANEEVDLLLGAFVGEETEKGCTDLKQVIGKCPIHDTEQFTILDHPTKIATLKGFFRMASGTSGFCQQCLQQQTVLLR